MMMMRNMSTCCLLELNRSPVAAYYLKMENRVLDTFEMNVHNM